MVTILYIFILLNLIFILVNAFRPIGIDIFRKLPTGRQNSVQLQAKKSWQPPTDIDEAGGDTKDGLVYTVELPKGSGINWGSDISFRWIYVQDVEAQSAASALGLIQKGDYIIGVGNVSTIAKDFVFVLDTIKNQEGQTFNYTFFRGTKEQLIGRPVIDPRQQTYKITVKQAGKEDIILSCPGGSNLRQVLVGNGINVYRSLAKWTNCSGKQRCGTCIVDIKSGMENCTIRSLEEATVLTENPDSYRLSCVTSVYGDVTVEVQSPVGAAQWTR